MDDKHKNLGGLETCLCNRNSQLIHKHTFHIISRCLDQCQQKSVAREEEDDEEEDVEARAQEDQELLDSINEAKEQNNGRLDDSTIVHFFKQKLHSMPCQNQGFVIDGFPKTTDQAKALFAGQRCH